MSFNAKHPNEREIFSVYYLISSIGERWEFEKLEELEEFIEVAFTESGGFDWIESIVDDVGTYYGCSWTLEIEKLN